MFLTSDSCEVEVNCLKNKQAKACDARNRVELNALFFCQNVLIIVH